ncbi:PIN domain-containing protein [Humibacter sp. BT305]|nr:PIN domain-containing protein [Humibacter sp. BT305]
MERQGPGRLRRGGREVPRHDDGRRDPRLHPRRAGSVGLIYLDSSIVISALQDAGSLGRTVREALAATAEIPATSDLVRLECRVRPIREGDFALATEFDRILDEFEQLTLDSGVYRVAADIRARFGLKTPDALHVAAAQVHRCVAFWTSDRQLNSVVGAMRFQMFDG